MTVSRRYTVEQLYRLVESPLVRKPDGLPDIKEWMESAPPEQGTSANNTNSNNSTRRPRTQSGREGAETPASENGLTRPSVLGTRNFSRGSTNQADEIILGPPKFSFASASNIRTVRGGDNADKRNSGGLEDETGGDRATLRDRLFSKDREPDRSRDKIGFINGRAGRREEGEGWTSVKSRKSLGHDDDAEKPPRLGDRDKDRSHRLGDVDGGDTAPRRGMGRTRSERLDQPWIRDDSHSANKDPEPPRLGSRTQGGWRDREPRRDDRDWGRSTTSRVEEDPEWMDAPVVKNEKKGAHTQEDFQKWKESMKMKSGTPTATPTEGKTLTSESASAVGETSTAPSAPSMPTATVKTPASAVDDAKLDQLFAGLWGAKPVAAENEILAARPGAAPTPTPSRFANFFTPQEELVKPPPEVPFPVAPTVTSPLPEESGSTEDKEGFQRILQMLGGSGTLSAQPTKIPTNGVRLSEPTDAPQVNRPPGLRSREERTALLEAVLAPRPSSGGTKSPMSGLGPFSTPQETPQGDQFRMRQEGVRLPEELQNQPAPRNGHIPEGQQPSHGINRGLHELQSQPPSLSRESEFLLGLMQSRPPPQQMPPNMGRPPMEAVNFPFFPDDKMGKGPMHKPNGPLPPPGMMDEYRMYSENERMRLQAQQDLRQGDNRRQMPFRPPGLPDDPSIIPGLQRRNTGENNPGRLQLPTNMGIPQQQMQEWMKQSGMQTPQERVLPPPGFNGPPLGVGQQQQGPQGQGIRQPPGLPHMPFSGGSTPLNHPPMGRGMGMPPPNMFGNQHQPGGGHQGPPGLQGLPNPSMMGQMHGQSQQHMPPLPLGYFAGPNGPGMGAPPGFPPMPMQGDGMMGMQARGRQHPPPPPFDMFAAEMGRGMGRAGGGSMGQQMPGGAGFGMG